jgi:hypothetical protein
VTLLRVAFWMLATGTAVLVVGGLLAVRRANAVERRHVDDPDAVEAELHEMIRAGR